MAINSRSKGRRGQQEAGNLLRSKDWTVAELNAGTAVEDFIGVDSQGKSWAVEVKNTKAIEYAHRLQAIEQAKARRLPWLLMSKIHGTGSWLVQRQGETPAVWS